jgi:hypothetical protein
VGVFLCMDDKLVLLKAEAKQIRDGKVINRGMTFLCPYDEAMDLIALSFASLVKEVGAEAEPRVKRRYRRRDMRAEH